MIKIDVVKGKKTTTLYFEQRQTTSEGLEELDVVYQALLGSDPKRGGYIDSNKFEIEVLNQD